MTTDAAAFDALAETYDREFTDTHLGKLLRRRTWEVFNQSFAEGQHLVELACGTGEDACRLAQRGIRVSGFDASSSMIEQARAKAVREGCEAQLAFEQADFDQMKDRVEGESYDGVVSNFGGLNVLDEDGVRQLSRVLAGAVKPGGHAVLVVMGPVCPLETLYYLCRFKPAAAFRRWKKSVVSTVGGVTVNVRYPGRRTLRKWMGNEWELVRSEALGFFLPPSFLYPFVERHQRLFSFLDKVERKISRIIGGWGDHYITTFRRVQNA